MRFENEQWENLAQEKQILFVRFLHQFLSRQNRSVKLELENRNQNKNKRRKLDHLYLETFCSHDRKRKDFGMEILNEKELKEQNQTYEQLIHQYQQMEKLFKGGAELSNPNQDEGLYV